MRAVANSVQASATGAATGRVGFLVAANQEGGLIQALAGEGFVTIPSAVVQGTWAPSLLEGRARTWGTELRAAGVNFNFAPVADVVPAGTESSNAPIGALRREFGSDPTTVASHVTAFVAGMAAADVATSAKHFPGLGRVEGNTDFTADVVDDVTTADDPYLRPFARAVTAGVPFVMVALATYERIDAGRLAAFSPIVVGSVLRRSLGFGGVVISDDLSAEAVASMTPATRALDFLAAGGDLLIVKHLPDATAMASAIAGAIRTSASVRARVDASALRILRAKDALGLLPCSG